MFIPLLLGCFTVIVSMGIQIFAIVFILQYLFKIVSSVGVLMFGVSAGAMLSIMSYLLAHDDRIKNQLAEIKKHSQKQQYE